MTHDADDEEPGVIRKYIPSCYIWSPLTRFPLAIKRPPSQESTLTDTSSPDSLFFKLSKALEAEIHITEPPRTSSDALARVSCSKGESTDALPDIFFSPAPVASLLKNKSRAKQFMTLERVQAQKYANFLDTVRYSIGRVLRLV